MQRDRIATTLTELGYDVYPSEANFVFFGGLGDHSGDGAGDQGAVWDALVDASVLVRDVGCPVICVSPPEHRTRPTPFSRRSPHHGDHSQHGITKETAT